MFASLAMRLLCEGMTMCQGGGGEAADGTDAEPSPTLACAPSPMEAQQASSDISSSLLGLLPCQICWYIVVWRLQVLAEADGEECLLASSFLFSSLL